ncbi:cadherin-10-like [Synchiropus picturatus]
MTPLSLLALLLSWTGSSGGHRPEGQQFMLIEEAAEGQFIGKLQSDQDPGDGSMKYLLSGEGADDLFTLDPHTGDLFASRPLDREEKAVYHLEFTVSERRTDRVVQPESAVTVLLRDVNDHAPAFSQDSYLAAVPENSNWGASVVQLSASDADEGLNAQIHYDFRGEHDYFSLDHETGLIWTAPIFPGDLDRERRESHHLVVVATDRAGLRGGLTATTQVSVTLTDVNDNPPRFAQDVFQFHVRESVQPGSAVGRLRAVDPDLGKNAEMKFSIVGGSSVFEVLTDQDTQEGVILVGKPLDYETRSSYRVNLQVENTQVPPGCEPQHTPDLALVEIFLENEVEAPVFDKDWYRMEVKEDAAVGTMVGAVHASDPDGAQSPIRYFINWDTDRKFDIDEATGSITVVGSLDREASACHNFSVTAAKLDVALPSRATVSICLLDVNDNAPLLVVEGAPFVCEGFQTAGQLIQVVSAVDPDDPPSGDKFSFSMASHTAPFTVQDSGDNTARILTQQATLDRSHQRVHLVPVVVSDGEVPMQWSTGTVTVKVCSCSHAGHCSSSEVLSWSPATLLWCLVAIGLFFIALLGKVLVQTLKETPAPVIVQRLLRRRGVTHPGHSAGATGPW